MNGDSIIIRRAEPGDVSQIVALLRDVVHQTYGHLLPNEPIIAEEPAVRWLKGWVATDRRGVVGVGLAEGDYIDDLWLQSAFRRKGIGSALLKKLEAQIQMDGHAHARLRVVAENHGARRFYARHGWREIKTYPHERWGFQMLDLRKTLGKRA